MALVDNDGDPRAVATRKGCEKKGGKRVSRWEEPFARPFAGPKGLCGARANGFADFLPLVRAQGAHCGTACARNDGDPVVCHWRDGPREGVGDLRPET